MPFRRRHPLHALRRLLPVLLLLGHSADAAAFCRQRSCIPVECELEAPSCIPLECVRDELGCVAEGLPLNYLSPCLRFGIAEGSAEPLGLTNDEFEALVAEAFNRWRSVECPGGGSPGFEVDSVGSVQTDGQFFCDALPESNLSVWSLSENWDYGPRSLGFTSSIFGTEDGSVMDADVELSLQRLLPLDREQRLKALLAIATHESGHVLGIGHSNVPSAIMTAAYSNSELANSAFAADDIDAICTIFPPNAELTCPLATLNWEAGLNQEACDEAASGAEAGACALGNVGSQSSPFPQVLLLGLVVVWLAMKTSRA